MAATRHFRMPEDRMDNLLDEDSGAPVDAGTPGEAAAAPRIAESVGHLQLAPDASNSDVLAALINGNPGDIIPWELCELPSGGRFYRDEAGNQWPDGTVRVRAMGQNAEKVLATSRLAESGQSIDYLFRECCQFPAGFDPLDLLVGDRTYLLYYLRGITHGNKYEFLVDCPGPECRKKSTHTYDLNELAATVRRPPESVGHEPFRLVLPYFSEVAGREVWVKVRFLRGVDLNNMVAKRLAAKRSAGEARPGRGATSLAARKAAQKNERVDLDDSLTKHLQSVIVEAMGDSNPFVIRSFIEKLHARDTATIREWLRDNTPGIDSTVSLVCPECELEFTVELPITEAFFRPSKS